MDECAQVIEHMSFLWFCLKIDRKFRRLAATTPISELLWRGLFKI